MESDIGILRQALISRNNLHLAQSEHDKWKLRINMERGFQILASRMRNNSIPVNIVNTITTIMSYLRNDRNFTDIDVDGIICEIKQYFPDNSYSTY